MLCTKNWADRGTDDVIVFDCFVRWTEQAGQAQPHGPVPFTRTSSNIKID